MNIPAGETSVCVACLKRLTDEERHCYEYRCEECEGKMRARISAWLDGAEDWDLDREAGFLHCQQCGTHRECAARLGCARFDLTGANR